MSIAGILSGNLGTDNQIYGLIAKYNEIHHNNENINIISSLDGKILHPKNFNLFMEFKKVVYEGVEYFLKQNNNIPKCIILPLNHGFLFKEENSDIDNLSLVVKEAFIRHNIKVKTVVLASNLYNYKNVDIIHIGEHLLSDEDEILLTNNNDLLNKIVKTVGVPSNISQDKIKNLYNNIKCKHILEEYKDRKNILFCLGGITNSKAIEFTLKDAEKLFKAALNYIKFDYNVIFVNSPRTPSDVTDFLYEKCLSKNINFFNAKEIAKNPEDEKNFRLYNGKFKKEFTEQAEKIGNIYPAILSICSKVVYTWDSFSYTSDASVIGITTIVYTGNKIDKKIRNDCHKLYKICRDRSFVINLEEDLELLNKDLNFETKPMEDVSVQVIKAIDKLC